MIACIEYEVVESEEYWYVAARLPVNLEHAPFVDIQKDRVRISAGDLEAIIPLKGTADVGRSFYDIRHGVVDVTVRKHP